MAVLAAAGGCAGCAALMGLVLALRIGVSVALPWWVAVLLPAVVYGVVAAVSLAGRSMGRKALGFVGLGAAHGAAVLAGAVVFTIVSGVPFGESVIEAGARFLPAPLLLLCAVPLALAPLRPFVNGEDRGHRHRAPTRREEPPWPGSRGEAVPGWYAWPREEAKPVESGGTGSSVPTMPPPPVTEPERAPRPVTRAWGEAPAVTREPVAVPVATAAEVAPRANVSAVSIRAAAPVAAPSSESSVPLTGLSPEPDLMAEGPREPVPADPHPAEPVVGPTTDRRDMVAVAFEHIAPQLPAAAFSVPVDRLGASLLEPERLLIPRDIILPQLAEGEVTVAWEDVADQFPAQTLAVARHAVGARLPQGRLVLPLAEVFAQLPPDVFALASTEMDVRGIESFSLPFQPEPPPPIEPEPTIDAPAASTVAPGERPAATAPSEQPGAEAPSERRATVTLSEGPAAPTPAQEGGATTQPAALLSQAEIATGESGGEEAAGEPVPCGPTPAATLASPLPDSDRHHDRRPEHAPPVPEPPPALDHPGDAVAPDQTQEPAAGDERSEPVPEASPSFTPRRPDAGGAEGFQLGRDADRGMLRALAQRLAPVGPLEADVLTIDGVRLHAFLAPTLPVETVMTVTAGVLGLLEPGRAPWPIDQLTVRLEDGAIVLTPLPAARGVRTLMAAAIRRGGSLAMLEISSKQAAVECMAVANGHPLSAVAVPGEDDAPLQQVSAGPAQRQVAGLLGGLGRLVPTVFRDGVDGLELSLFVGADEDVLAVARYAHRACRALSGETPPGLGPVRSAVARTGDRRLVLMPMDGAPGRWTVMLTATAEPARPGLVRLHAERAAARLAAS